MEQRLESFLTLCDTMHYGRAAESYIYPSLRSVSISSPWRINMEFLYLPMPTGVCRKPGKVRSCSSMYRRSGIMKKN